MEDFASERAAALDRLAQEHFDVVVIGGGITGAGVALDAASRGLKTALVERDDFASGTSSKSSKMVHGGLRYLEQREFRLVYQNLAERQRLLENAPHLVRPLPFLIPLFGRDGVVSKTVARTYSTALWLYDITGGLRIGHRHRRVTRDEVVGHLPTMNTERLVAGFVYHDARADDARLTLAIIRTAVIDHGAVAINHAPVTALLPDGGIEGGRLSGVSITPEDSAGGEIDISASVVVNATGVWGDVIEALEGDRHRPTLRPAKGVHITVPSHRLPCDIASVIPVRSDRRSIFVVPWPDADLTYIGTTDTSYDGSLDEPLCTPEDVEYLLTAVNAVTTSTLTVDDVTGVWAGLRPLLDSTRPTSDRTADLSRRHTVRTTDRGMVTVTGGKLTTYRLMAEDTVDVVQRELEKVHSSAASGSAARRRCKTKSLPIKGAGTPPSGDPGTSEARLFARYGTESSAVLALGDDRPELLEPIIQGLPYIGAEVLFAVRAEWARTLEDICHRRLRATIEDARATAAAAPDIARLVAPELGWDEAGADARVKVFVEAVHQELKAAGIEREPGGGA